jgi:hypothetical protein
LFSYVHLLPTTSPVHQFQSMVDGLRSKSFKVWLTEFHAHIANMGVIGRFNSDPGTLEANLSEFREKAVRS